MSATEKFITDYEENRDDIEKWMSVKCEQKYRRFADLLKKNGIETTWINITDLYRYDKRLLFNAFRYISFEEEYLRARAVRSSEDPENEYEKLQGKSLSGLIIELSSLGLIDSSEKKILDSVRKLRNAVSHNKILLEQKGIKGCFAALYRALPVDYRGRFAEEIEKCRYGLEVSETFAIDVGHARTVISTASPTMRPRRCAALYQDSEKCNYVS